MGLGGPQFTAGLAAILRLGLLAITFAAALSIVADLVRGPAVSRATGASLGVTYLALAMAAVSVVLMVALTVNAAFLVDSLFSRSLAGYLVVVVVVLGAGAIAVGSLGAVKLRALTTVSVLVPGVAFALNMLMVRLLGRPSPRR